MRLKEDTLRALNILAGEIQVETGKSVSADAALREFILQFRPDVMRKAESTTKTRRDEKEKAS